MLDDLKDIDFSSVIDSDDPLATRKFTQMVDLGALPDAEMAIRQVAEEVRKIPNRESRDLLVAMLKVENAQVPVKFILRKGVLDLIREVNREVGSDKRNLFDALVNPVWEVVKDFARLSSATAGSRLSTTDALARFRSLKPQDQEGLLHRLAISLYQPGGADSLDPVSLLVVQAGYYDEKVALLCASLIMLPLILGAVLLGNVLSLRLVARNRTRLVVSREAADTSELESPFTKPVELYGRSEVLRGLRNLARRGWSTIGVVGRRGVGKSRLLHALATAETDGKEEPIINVSVSSPSRFQEEDFIRSMLERLALSTEASIARYLGVRPISIRRMDSRTAQVGTYFYTGALIVLATIVLSRAGRLSQVDIVVIWLPILALVFASILLYLRYLSKLQPVDLSSWLRRDRIHNLHTVILYREVYEVLRDLRHRAQSGRADPADSGRRTRTLLMWLIGIDAGFLVSSFFGVITGFGFTGSTGEIRASEAVRLGITLLVALGFGLIGTYNLGPHLIAASLMRKA
jgi:hypothetical protein